MLGKTSLTGTVPVVLRKIPVGQKCSNALPADFKTIYAQDSFKAGGSEHNCAAEDGIHEQLVVVLAAEKMAKPARFLAPREIIMKGHTSRPGLGGPSSP